MSEFSKRWSKVIRESGKPAYQAIAELIANDIKSGRLTAKDRLPPLRELAEDLGLNYTTAARGYAEARRRGLIDARAGRGTFIRSASARQPARRGSLLEMTMNLPPEPHDPHVLDRFARGLRIPAFAKRSLFIAALPGIRRPAGRSRCRCALAAARSA